MLPKLHGDHCHDQHHNAHSALSDRLGIPADKIDEQRLYRALDALLPHKEALEVKLCPGLDGAEIRRRRVTPPTDHQAILLAHLGVNLPSIPLTDGA
jgi:hypothetical protein